MHDKENICGHRDATIRKPRDQKTDSEIYVKVNTEDLSRVSEGEAKIFGSQSKVTEEGVSSDEAQSSGKCSCSCACHTSEQLDNGLETNETKSAEEEAVELMGQGIVQ